MSERAKQPPAKQFVLRQRASDRELLELYFQQDAHLDRIQAITQRAEAVLKAAQGEVDAEKAKLQIMADRILAGRKQEEVPVIAVMNPTKSEKTLFYPEDTTFQTPIAVIPMVPEDYELPLL